MVIWVIGLSGAGKTTLATQVVEKARKELRNVVLIDGDAVREMFGNDLGFSIDDRRRNADRISRLCKFLDDQGIHVVCAILSLFHESQDWNRENFRSYFEVYIETPMKDLVDRDSKGLYRGERKRTDVVGVDIPFRPPKAPDLVINNSNSRDQLLGYADELVDRLAGRL